jgi:hypothetical protein
MDYNDFELFCFWMLSGAPALILITIGIAAHNKLSTAWQPRYLVLGISSCFVYAVFAGRLIAPLFPPPYVPGLSEGRGLDLRGVGFFIGPWIGALAGTIAALVTVGVFQTLKSLRPRRTLGDGL